VAELNPESAAAPAPYHAAPDIPAATQLLAIAWLRWRMFANGFRRRQTGPRQIVALVFSILLRLLIWPAFAFMAIGPAVGAGFFAYMAISDGHPQHLSPLLAAVALLWQFVAVNGVSMAAALATFDPASLLRFPLRFGRYLVLRLLLGLLTPSTIIGCLALLAAVIGIAMANVSLLPAAVVVLALYAALNIFISRTLAVWMERWLATRRAREIFGVLMAVVIVGFQFVSYRGPMRFRRPTGHPSASPNNWLLNFLHGSNHLLAWFPPGFAAGAILPGHPLLRLAEFAALLAWTALFFAAFAFRLHKQFLGEYLSDGAPRSAPAPKSVISTEARQRVAERPPHLSLPSPGQQPAPSFLSPSVAACLRKEWVYLRGNSSQLVAMLTPLIFVFILGRGMLAQHPSYLLSGAVGYAMLGLLAALYNIFGADGAGVQLYLLAPVRLRDVILAKNIASLALLAFEAALAWCVASVLATAPIPLSTQLSTFFWVVFVLFANLTLGTLRSIQAPRKITLNQARALRTPAANRTSGLLVLAVLFGSMLLQVPVMYLCRHFHNAWLGPAIFAPLAAVSVAVYALLLQNADHLILTHRDTFAEELSKA
jgi:ABC-2 type transport system permease protein